MGDIHEWRRLGWELRLWVIFRPGGDECVWVTERDTQGEPENERERERGRKRGLPGRERRRQGSSMQFLRFLIMCSGSFLIGLGWSITLATTPESSFRRHSCLVPHVASFLLEIFYFYPRFLSLGKYPFSPSDYVLI